MPRALRAAFSREAQRPIWCCASRLKSVVGLKLKLKPLLRWQ